MINIANFLFPISEDNECGEYLRYENIYDQIREHRREDDQSLSQGIWQTDLKKANWQEVIRICSELLRTRTKDLQIAMWFLEALTATEGFSGLDQGISLVRSLCEKFWDNIYPHIDSENQDMSYRMAPFHFFADKIPERIVLIPLIGAIDGVSDPYSLSDWMTARHNLQIKNNKGLSLKQIKKSVAATSLEFFETLELKINVLLEKLKSLSNFLNEKNEKEAPSFHGIFSYFEDIKHIISQSIIDKKTQMANEVPKPSQENKNDSDPEEDAPSPKETPNQSSDISIEDAYDKLTEIADFLEKAQPQSPASTLVKIASAIGKKTFQELLEMNLKSGASVMHTISELHRILSVG